MAQVALTNILIKISVYALVYEKSICKQNPVLSKICE